MRIHSNFLYGKKYIVIFLYGVLCNIFLCVRIHSKFFVCVHYIVIFCMGKNASNFFVWQFLLCGNFFVWCFFLCSIPASPYLYTLWFSPFLLDTTQLYHHHWIEQGRLPLVHAKKKYTLLKKIDCSTIVSRMVSHYTTRYCS